MRTEIGVDPIAGNFTAFSPRVQKQFFDTGDELHLTEFYVSELLERGGWWSEPSTQTVIVCFRGWSGYDIRGQTRLPDLFDQAIEFEAAIVIA